MNSHHGERGPCYEPRMVAVFAFVVMLCATLGIAYAERNLR